jgi:trigger factor
MKSAVETLGPTRIKLTVEVPFEELKPAIDAAYRKVGQQIRVKGFRPGKVPPRMIDQQVGRGAVLEEAINEAVPGLYGDALREKEIEIIGHPEIEVTQFNDGEDLIFVAEVDVRPEIELPDYDGLPVTVEDAEFTEDEINEQLQGLRDRFATLAGVEREAATGDYVAIDLSATIDGEVVEDAAASNLSYEVGSDSLVTGLDEAIIGLAVDGSKEFETQLRTGDQGGQTALATVTVRSVKEKQVPELDDDFASTASEFETIDELKDDIRARMTRIKTLTQGVQARDKVLEVLLEKVEVPIPQHVLGDEITYRSGQLDQQLAQAGLTKEVYAESQEKTVEELDQEIAENAEQAIKAQFVLDAIAKKEELGVEEADITDQIVRRAQQAGMAADRYAQEVVNAGQLGSLMSDILRGKALALVMERATITDASGRPVDLESLSAPIDEDEEAILEEIEAAEAVGDSDDVEADSDESIDDEVGDGA